MNLPNRLTLLRIVLVPVICACMVMQKGCMWIAAVLFAVAAVTDFADGKIARSRNLITDFGKFMDPIADKLLVICPMILLVGLGRFPAWMCALVVARELAVSGFRLVAALADRVIAADKLGKYKTTCQIVCILLLLLLPSRPWSYLGDLFAWAATILTVWSGAECIWKNRDLLADM
ncbi:MAG: CDP-diacylglycerol--glycerol-3-phosphate 3-phosphatidyltransferase [Eubacteriales bacterium]|nr:CDP-diacylglycerol--glycerol-3-phosphate 3-phosphatidyltransferase [Eubacteriales bacterium]